MWTYDLFIIYLSCKYHLICPHSLLPRSCDADGICVQVLGWDVERVKPLILDPVGSQITISFQRVGSQVAGKRSIDVVMVRQLVDP